jgi:hypothetical protein
VPLAMANIHHALSNEDALSQQDLRWSKLQLQTKPNQIK